jgi:hypothetical protein
MRKTRSIKTHKRHAKRHTRRRGGQNKPTPRPEINTRETTLSKSLAVRNGQFPTRGNSQGQPNSGFKPGNTGYEYNNSVEAFRKKIEKMRVNNLGDVANTLRRRANTIKRLREEKKRLQEMKEEAASVRQYRQNEINSLEREVKELKRELQFAREEEATEEALEELQGYINARLEIIQEKKDQLPENEEEEEENND